MSPSYQLPDLLSLGQQFELQTNRSCRAATTASESWLLGLKSADLNNVLTPLECTTLPPTKVGLLAALCFPRCDLPQLRFFTDFLSILIISAQRIRHARNLNESGWWGGETGDGFKCLDHHDLFQYLRPQLLQLTSKASAIWNIRFAHSVHSYRSAQRHIIADRLNNSLPNLETYTPLRRDSSGLFMIFDLVELTENLALPHMDEKTTNKLSNLKQTAIDIVACSLDVVAFNNDQAQGNRHNLITILMAHKGITLQGAQNLAGLMIKEMFDSFMATERSLLDPSPPSSQGRNISSYRDWIPFARLLPATRKLDLEHENDLSFLDNLSSYIQVLKDCIVGTINWAYETELYFGKKGEEIRAFGWVFLSPKMENEGQS